MKKIFVSWNWLLQISHNQWKRNRCSVHNTVTCKNIVVSNSTRVNGNIFQQTLSLINMQCLSILIIIELKSIVFRTLQAVSVMKPWVGSIIEVPEEQLSVMTLLIKPVLREPSFGLMNLKITKRWVYLFYLSRQW